MGGIEETSGINAMMIVEVIGKPPSHLSETLERIIKEIGGEKDVVVLSKKINDPKEMEKQKGFYMNFAEIEVEVKDILRLVILMFKYMPAHIEIMGPEAIVLTNNGWNDVLNELTRRLHGYDEMARIVQVEKNILEKRLREALEGGAENGKLEKDSKKGGKK
jgi:hypothetical protein